MEASAGMGPPLQNAVVVDQVKLLLAVALVVDLLGSRDQSLARWKCQRQWPVVRWELQAVVLRQVVSLLVVKLAGGLVVEHVALHQKLIQG